MPSTSPTRMLRTKQAAQYLGISPWMLRKLTQDGLLKVMQLTPSSPFEFDLKDLDRFIESHKRNSPWDRSVLP